MEMLASLTNMNVQFTREYDSLDLIEHVMQMFEANEEQ